MPDPPVMCDECEATALADAPFKWWHCRDPDCETAFCSPSCFQQFHKHGSDREHTFDIQEYNDGPQLRVCDVCSTEAAADLFLRCDKCNLTCCPACDAKRHKAGARSKHLRVPAEVGKAAAPEAAPLQQQGKQVQPLPAPP